MGGFSFISLVSPIGFPHRNKKVEIAPQGEKNNLFHAHTHAFCGCLPSWQDVRSQRAVISKVNIILTPIPEKFKQGLGLMLSYVDAHFNDIDDDSLWGIKREAMNLSDRCKMIYQPGCRFYRVLEEGIICEVGPDEFARIQSLASNDLGLGLLDKYIENHHASIVLAYSDISLLPAYIADEANLLLKDVEYTYQVLFKQGALSTGKFMTELRLCYLCAAWYGSRVTCYRVFFKKNYFGNKKV